MFEQTFKNIDDILHKDAGCSSELDYVEQTSWVLFLKYLDDLEAARVKAEEAVYIGDLYSVDVLGARGAGLEAILLDPGGVWGDRDCPKAKSLSEAVELALSG